MISLAPTITPVAEPATGVVDVDVEGTERHTLTYPTDVRHMVGEIVGSTNGRLFVAAEADLGDDGRTRVLFVRVNPDVLDHQAATTGGAR